MSQLLKVPSKTEHICEFIGRYLPTTDMIYHLYLMGLFAATSIQLHQQLQDFQKGYGFAWWQSDLHRLAAEANQDKFVIPARPQPGYWQSLVSPSSQWYRQRQYHTVATDAMSTEPPVLSQQLMAVRQRWDKAQQTHAAVLPKNPGTLQGWCMAGNPDSLRQTLQSLVLPSQSHHLVCALLSRQPINEYEALCQRPC